MSASRTWVIPSEPEGVERVRDCYQIVWARGAEGFWEAPGFNGRSWGALLDDRSPLTEVVETEVEAAARRLREHGFTGDEHGSYAGQFNDIVTVARHVLNGGAL